MENNIILSHPTGNANVRAVADGFLRHRLLDRFYTGLACHPGSWYYPLLKGPLTPFRKRTFDRKLQPYTRTYPNYELGRMVAGVLKKQTWLAHETGRFSVDRVYQTLDAHVASQLAKAQQRGADAVYAYEDGALASFREAKKLGMACLYDLPIAYWEFGHRLMREEAERLPEWSSTLGGGIRDSEAKRERKVQELELADVVIGPGSFVLDSLPDWAKHKATIMAPFGSPVTTDAAHDEHQKKQDKQKSLRILFVGSMGQRKGLGDLFAAMKLLKGYPVELVVLGSLLAPMEFYSNQLADFIYEPTRSHAEVLALMRTCDVFCLPSIVEGRALVMQEAMSQGLPLIITPNTGGQDLVIEGKTGFLVSVRSPEGIAEKISWFSENRELLPDMGQAARLHAQTYTWRNYADTVVSETKKILKI